MKILLIAGHGAGDPGAVGNGCKEADLTRELAKLIQDKLKNYATVDIADTNINWYSHICEKGAGFNFKGYDYVLELHFNAIKPDAGDGKTKGVEIYVTKQEKGTTVEENIIKRIASIGFTNRGVQRKNWGVITYIKNQGVSSALLEVCFIDDADDMALYKNTKQGVAISVVNGIVEGFGLKAIEKAPSDIDIIKSKIGLEQQTIEYLQAYKYGAELIRKIANAVK